MIMVQAVPSEGGLHGYDLYKGCKYFINHTYRIRRTYTRRMDVFLVFVTFLLSVVVEIILAVKYPPEAERYLCILKALMGISVFRIILLNDDLARICFSLIQGLAVLGSYAMLVGTLVYMFASLFTERFKEVNPSFATLEDSLIAMFQLMVGEGWHEVMYATTSQTSRTYAWWFFVYIFVITLLFVSLLVGIIIEMFTEVQERWKMTADDGRSVQTIYILLENIMKDRRPGTAEKMLKLLRSIVHIRRVDKNSEMQLAADALLKAALAGDDVFNDTDDTKTVWNTDSFYAEKLQSYYEVFDMLDSDKSGEITCDELGDALATLVHEGHVTGDCEDVNRETFKQVVQALDTSKDGSINKREFAVFLRRAHQYAVQNTEPPGDKHAPTAASTETPGEERDTGQAADKHAPAALGDAEAPADEWV